MNLMHADERERETKLKEPTSVYLLTAEVKPCCFFPGQERYWTAAVRKRGARCLALVQQARDRERGSSIMKKEEKDSLSSHPHYVNEVHDCSVGPSRVNYQWLLSLIG